jgi:hypothetical protein
MKLMETQKPSNTVPRTYGGFLKYTFFKIWEKKKIYLLPLWIVLGALALLLVLSGNSHLLPAIYLAF